MTVKIPTSSRYLAYVRPLVPLVFVLLSISPSGAEKCYTVDFVPAVPFSLSILYYFYRLQRENGLRVKYRLSGPWLIKEIRKGKEERIDLRKAKLLVYNTPMGRDSDKEKDWRKLLNMSIGMFMSLMFVVERSAYILTSEGEKMTFPSGLMTIGTDTEFFISPIFSSIDKTLLPEDFQMIFRYPG